MISRPYRALCWTWSAGTLAWLPWKAVRIGLLPGEWLPGFAQIPGLPPDHMPPGLPELPPETLLGPMRDLLLPPLIVLVAALLLVWLWRGWRNT